MTEEVSIDLEEIIEREKNSNKSKDGRKKLYILITLVIIVISGIVVTLLTNFYSSQKGNTYISSVQILTKYLKIPLQSSKLQSEKFKKMDMN